VRVVTAVLEGGGEGEGLGSNLDWANGRMGARGKMEVRSTNSLLREFRSQIYGLDTSGSWGCRRWYPRFQSPP